MVKYHFLVTAAALIFLAGDVTGGWSDCNNKDANCISGSCDFEKPPLESYPVQWNGSYVFSYPRTINSTYFRQCRTNTVWDEQGKKLWITRFDKLEPVMQIWYKEDGTSVSCEVREIAYEKDGVKCWDSKSIKQVMKAMLPVKADPLVPKERDPRKKPIF
jgi:hypothetical protein